MPYVHKGSTLYTTRDDQVVAEGDERAAFVLVADGGTLSDELATKYGLAGAPSDEQAAGAGVKATELEAELSEEEPPDEEETKAKSATPNKAKAAKAENKGA